MVNETMDIDIGCPVIAATQTNRPEVQAPAQFAAHVITPGEIPFVVYSGHGTTTAQLLEATVGQQHKDNFEVMTAMGTELPSTAVLQPDQYYIVSQPKAVQHDHTDQPPSLTEMSRARALWQQKGWVARDELEYYMYMLECYHPGTTYGTLVLREATDQHVVFTDFVLKAIRDAGMDQEDHIRTCAVLHQNHWFPIFVKAKASDIQVWTSHDMQAQVKQWIEQGLGAQALPVSSLPMPTAFPADCGFQTIGWLLSVMLEEDTTIPFSQEQAIQWRSLFHRDLLATGQADLLIKEPLQLGGTQSQRDQQALVTAHGVAQARGKECAEQLIVALGSQAIHQILHPSREHPIRSKHLSVHPVEGHPLPKPVHPTMPTASMHPVSDHVSHDVGVGQVAASPSLANQSPEEHPLPKPVHPSTPTASMHPVHDHVSHDVGVAACPSLANQSPIPLAKPLPRLGCGGPAQDMMVTKNDTKNAEARSHAEHPSMPTESMHPVRDHVSHDVGVGQVAASPSLANLSPEEHPLPKPVHPSMPAARMHSVHDHVSHDVGVGQVAASPSLTNQSPEEHPLPKPVHSSMPTASMHPVRDHVSHDVGVGQVAACPSLANQSPIPRATPLPRLGCGGPAQDMMVTMNDTKSAEARSQAEHPSMPIASMHLVRDHVFHDVGVGQVAASPSLANQSPEEHPLSKPLHPSMPTASMHPVRDHVSHDVGVGQVAACPSLANQSPIPLAKPLPRLGCGGPTQDKMVTMNDTKSAEARSPAEHPSMPTESMHPVRDHVSHDVGVGHVAASPGLANQSPEEHPLSKPVHPSMPTTSMHPVSDHVSHDVGVGQVAASPILANQSPEEHPLSKPVHPSMPTASMHPVRDHVSHDVGVGQVAACPGLANMVSQQVGANEFYQDPQFDKLMLQALAERPTTTSEQFQTGAVPVFAVKRTLDSHQDDPKRARLTAEPKGLESSTRPRAEANTAEAKRAHSASSPERTHLEPILSSDSEIEAHQAEQPQYNPPTRFQAKPLPRLGCGGPSPMVNEMMDIDIGCSVIAATQTNRPEVQAPAQLICSPCNHTW